MILIGQYDSPFVRRVDIALREYDMPFEHRRWSVWGDADKIGAARAMIPREGAARRDALRVISLATGTADKALEDDRARRTSGWWLGEQLSHADVAVGCMLRFVGDAHPPLLDEARFPRLLQHAARCEARPSFREILQPIVNNLRPRENR